MADGIARHADHFAERRIIEVFKLDIFSERHTKDMNIMFVSGQAKNENVMFVSSKSGFSYNQLMEHRLKIIRKNLDLTQGELAELCDTSLRMIQFLEKGQRQLTPKWMEIFQRVLKIEPWMLWVDPDSIVSESDKNIIFKYKKLSSTDKQKVDNIFNSSSEKRGREKK